MLELDDQHLEAATALERLFHMTERYEDLAAIYMSKAAMLPDPDEQKSHLFRGAQIYEELLERPAAAIEVYQKVLEADAEDQQALDKLVELHLRMEQWPQLLEVYERKADVVYDPDEKKRIYVEMGAVYERELNDVEKAIDTYQRILEIDPDDWTAIQRLDQLYQTTQNWQELMSVLEREADLAQDPMEVISYRYRIGELWHRRLEDPERAVDIYRDILDIDPTHEPTTAALEAMIAEGTDPVASASVLEPIYRQLGESARLISVHEVQIANEEDPLRAVELLHQVAELHHVHLGQVDHAFHAYARALPLDNRNEVTLTNLQTLADQVHEGWNEVTRLYDVEIERIRNEYPDDVVDMALRTAQLYEIQVGDVDRAIERYNIVIGADEMNIDAINALDRLYEASNRPRELAEVLQRQIQVAATPDDILNNQFRLGQVYQQQPRQRGRSARAVPRDPRGGARAFRGDGRARAALRRGRAAPGDRRDPRAHLSDERELGSPAQRARGPAQLSGGSLRAGQHDAPHLRDRGGAGRRSRPRVCVDAARASRGPLERALARRVGAARRDARSLGAVGEYLRGRDSAGV